MCLFISFYFCYYLKSVFSLLKFVEYLSQGVCWTISVCKLLFTVVIVKYFWFICWAKRAYLDYNLLQFFYWNIIIIYYWNKVNTIRKCVVACIKNPYANTKCGKFFKCTLWRNHFLNNQVLSRRLLTSSVNLLQHYTPSWPVQLKVTLMVTGKHYNIEPRVYPS